MPISISVKDERETTVPPISPEAFKVQPVVDHADIVTAPDEDLNIEVILHNGAMEQHEDHVHRTPTSHLTHGMKEELYELTLVDAKSGETVVVWQTREVPDHNTWSIHIMILPKEELGYGGARAISRAISREIFSISVERAYGEALAMIYATPKDYTEAQTKFADDAPWAVS